MISFLHTLAAVPSASDMLVLLVFSVPTIVGLALAHKFVSLCIAWLLFSSLVDGMPKPDANSSVAYRWLHGTLNLLAGNFFRFACALLPRFGGVFNGTEKGAESEENHV